jgi:hypothetical protein
MRAATSVGASRRSCASRLKASVRLKVHSSTPRARHRDVVGLYLSRAGRLAGASGGIRQPERLSLSTNALTPGSPTHLLIHHWLGALLHQQSGSIHEVGVAAIHRNVGPALFSRR